MPVGIVSSLSLLIALGAPLPAPAETPPVTMTTQATICNKYCDGRDAALAPADRVPVSAGLYGRVFKAHVNDTDAMA